MRPELDKNGLDPEGRSIAGRIMRPVTVWFKHPEQDRVQSMEADEVTDTYARTDDETGEQDIVTYEYRSHVAVYDNEIVGLTSDGEEVSDAEAEALVDAGFRVSAVEKRGVDWVEITEAEARKITLNAAQTGARKS